VKKAGVGAGSSVGGSQNSLDRSTDAESDSPSSAAKKSAVDAGSSVGGSSTSGPEPAQSDTAGSSTGSGSSVTPSAQTEVVSGADGSGVGEATSEAAGPAGAGAGQGGDAVDAVVEGPTDADTAAAAEVATPGAGVASAPDSGPVTETVSADVSEAAVSGTADRDTGRGHSPRPAATSGQLASSAVAGVSAGDVADVGPSAAAAERVVPVVQGVAVTPALTPVPGDGAPVPVGGESLIMSAAEPAAESTALSQTALLTVLAPLVAPGTGAPVEPPTMWALLAFARRQIGAEDASPGDQNLLGTPEVGEPELSGLAFAAAAAEEAPPVEQDLSVSTAEAGESELSGFAALAAAAADAAPTVSITAPADGATVSGVVTLAADASDDVGVVGVQFLVNGAAVADELTDAPYSVSVPTTAAYDGTYVVSAVARDAAGNTTVSEPVTFVVANGTGGPTAAITSAGGPVSGLITLTATASDPDGVAGVQFLVDGGPLEAELVDAPYSLSVLSTAEYDGTYVVSARARDSLGNFTTSAPVTIIVDNTAPTVVLTAPADGATVSGVVTLSATAADGVEVAGVQFLVNGGPLEAELTDAPYSLAVATSAAYNGTYTLTAVARDTAGNLTTSAPVTITVANEDVAPTVEITSAGGPIAGLVTVTATASDDVGVVGVQFVANGFLVGAEMTGAPYSVSALTTAAEDGTYVLTAIARDAAGNLTTSAPVTIIVDNTAPTVALTAPADGATVSGTVTLSAIAADNVEVAGVQFHANGVEVEAEDTADPYSVSWDTTALTNGSYTLTAVARDTAGNTTTSAPLTVTVNNIIVVNHAPVAGDDSYAVAEDTVMVVPAGIGVLVNDADVDGDALAAVVVTNPAHGSLGLNPDGSFTYTPNANYHGEDSFVYTVSDGTLGDNATVSITLIPVNDAPDVFGDIYNTAEDTTLTIPASTGVLANDTDVDGDTVTAALFTGPSHAAQFTLNADGSFSYTPAADFNGTDSFTYTVADGTLTSNTATVTVTVTTPQTPNTVVATIPAPAGSSPQWIAFNASGTRGYVANKGTDTVSVIDTATNTITGTITVGDQPTTVQRGPNGNIYVNNTAGGSVSVIDPTSNTVIATIGLGSSQPLNIAFDNNGLGYVTGGNANRVTIINLATNTVVGNLPLTGRPAGATVTPDGAYLWVTSQLAPARISVISTATHQVVTTIPMGSYPTVVKFNNAGTLAYVTNQFSNKVYVVNTATNTVTTQIPVGQTPIDIQLNADSTRAYVTNFSGINPNDLHPGSVSVIDLTTNAVTATIPVGNGPVGSSITPDGTHLYVVNAGGSVSVIALGSSTAVNVAPVVGNPAFSVDSIDAVTGVVAGSVNVTDAQPLAYTVPDDGAGAPAYGTVVIAPDGTFAYTPTQAARVQAGLGQIEQDSFTVTVSDGEYNVPVTVTGISVSNPVTFVLNGDANTPITVAYGPANVAVSPDGTRAYIVNNGSGTVSVIDTATNTVIGAPIPVGSAPFGVAISPDGGRAYVTTLADDTVSVIDTATNTVIGNPIAVGNFPYGIAVSPDGTRAYVTNLFDDTVSVIDTATNTVIGDPIPVGVRPAGVAVSLDGTRAYITNESDNTVSVIDTATNTVIGDPISVGDFPRGVTISPDGGFAYVTNQGDGTVSVVDTATNTVIGDPIPVGLQPFYAVFSPDGSLAYINNWDGGTVSVIDTATHTVIDTNPATPEVDALPVGPLPVGVAVSPDGTRVYVTHQGGSVSVIALEPTAAVNDAPVAVGDTATVAEGGSTTISVLANDTDAEGTIDTTSVVIVQQPAYGSASVNAGGTITYVSNGAEVTSDSFTYTVADNSGASSNTATVTVTVTAVNDAPVAGTPAFTVTNVNTASGVVTGTVSVTDVDGPGLSYVLSGAPDPAVGVVVVNAGTGGWTFTPTGAARLAAYSGAGADSVDFAVTASDGQDSVVVTVSATIEGAEAAVTGSIAVGSNPSWLAVSPDGARAYVSNLFDGTVSVIDTATNTVIDTDAGVAGVNAISVGGSAWDMALSPDGTRLYVTKQNNSTVSVIDTTTYTLVDADPAAAGVNPISVGGQPWGLAVSPDGTRVYVTSRTTNTVAVIDTATNTLIDTDPGTAGVTPITVGGQPLDAAVSPDGTRLYVANWSDGTVSVIDTAAYGVIDTDPATAGTTPITVGGQPAAVAVSPDGARVYVTNFNGTVAVVDTATNSLVDTNPGTAGVNPITVGGQLQGVAVSPDGDRLYVTDIQGDRVSVIDTATNTIVERVTGIDGANGVAVHPDGDRIYVTALNTNSVVVITSVYQTPNAAPVASSDTITIPEDSLLEADLADSASDTDGDPLTAVLVSDVTHGALTFNPDRTFTYIPNPDYAGLDGFTYKVNDGSVDSNTATVTIVVTPLNDAPVAGSDSYSAVEDTVLDTAAAMLPGVLANDTDPDSGTILSVLAETKATTQNGTVTINADGSFTYTPAANFAGEDSFTYTVTDSSAETNDTASATVTVAVAAVADDPPVLPDPQHPYTLGAPLPGDPPGTLRGTFNATDPQGLAITYSYSGSTTLADGSTLTVDPDGTFVYQPSEQARHNAAADDAAQTGADTLTFDVTATNTAGSSITFGVSLGIDPANQQPHAPASAPTVAIDPADGTVTSSTGWTDPDADTLAYHNPDGSAATSWATTGGGTVTMQPDGSFSYTPDPHDRLNAYIHPDQSTDTFDVVVTDGHGSTQTITVTVPIDPTVAVTHSISSEPIDNLHSVTPGSDGTVAITSVTGSGAEGDPYSTTVTVLRAGQTTPTTHVISVNGYSQDGALVAADGTVALATSTGSGTEDDPYQMSVMVLRDGENPTTTTVTGLPSGTLVVGADGTVALTTYTGSGDEDDPFQTTVTVLRDGETIPATATVIGFPAGAALVGDGGTVALTTYTGSGGSTQTSVTVLRDGETTPITITVTESLDGLQVGADDTVALTTATGSGTEADPYQTTVLVLRPGETTPTSTIITGLSYGNVQVGADGTVAQTTITGSGTEADPYQTTVTVLRDGETIPTTATVAGNPLGAKVGADGTVALTTLTGSGAEADPYQTTLTVLRPGQTTPTTTTVTGYMNGGVQVGADGTVALTTLTGSGAEADPYQTTVTVLHPGEATPTTAAVTGVGSAQVGADGTVALTTSTGSGIAGDPFQATVTVLRPGHTTPATATVTGTPSDAQVGNDGTVALTTYTGSGTEADPYQTTVTVLRPSETTSTTITGSPAGNAQVGADGTVSQATLTGSGTAADPFVVTASVITLADVNDAPIARSDSYSTAEDTPLNTVAAMLPGVLTNDTDHDSGDTLSVLAETKGTSQGGTVTINSDGSFSYSPAANFAGQDSFTYTVTDGTVTSNTAIVTVAVTAVNDVPVALGDVAGVVEGGATTVAVLANDTDSDGTIDSATVVIVQQPTSGSVLVNTDGTVTYTSSGAEVTSDSFTYTVADNSGTVSNTAIVTVTVTAVNDAPVAVDDTATVAEGGSTTVTVLGNDTDADGTLNAATVLIVQQPTSGSVSVNTDGTITYTSSGAEVTSDSFSYTVADNSGASSNTAIVTVAVTAVNDVPVALGDVAGVVEGGATTVAVLGNDTDSDGTIDSATVLIVQQPAFGSASVNTDGTITYTSSGAEVTSDSFSYTVADNSGTVSNTAIVTVTVTAVNDAPVAVNDTATVDEGGATTVAVLGNDTDSDGTIDSATVLIVQQPSFGSALVNTDGTITYSSSGAEVTSDSFTYTVADNSGATSNTATVTVTVTAVNDVPVAVDDVAGVVEGGTTTVTVLGNDTDSDGTIDSTTVLIVQQPTNGSVLVNTDGTITYTSSGAEVTSDSFTYTVADNSGTVSNTAIVTVTVTAVNDAPVAVNDTATVDEGGATTVAVLGNDTDADGTLNAATVLIIQQPTNGSVLVNTDGTITYTSSGAEVTSDSFSYTVADNSGATSNTAIVTVTVTPVNDVPVGTGDTYATNEDIALNSASAGKPSLLANDIDPDTGTNAGLTVTAESKATAQGNTVTINADGSFVYTPTLNFNGTDSFTYTVRDAANASTVGTATVTVTAVNDAPVGTGDTYDTNEDIALNSASAGKPSLLANDIDPDTGTNAGLTVTAQTKATAQGGTVAINADGSFLYTPKPNWSGTDSFTYTVRDAANASTVGTATVSVAAVNDPPVANNNSGYTATEDTSLNSATAGLTNLLANDTDPENSALTAVAETNKATAQGGTVTINSDGSFVYQPKLNFNGTDSFTYAVSDGALTSNAATVTISITPVNDAPAATGGPTVNPADNAGVVKGNLNIVDPDNDTLSYTFSQPATGTLTIASGGVFTYTANGPARLAAYNSPNTDYESFSVVVSDGKGGTTTVAVNNVEIAPSHAAFTGTIDLGGDDWDNHIVEAPNGKSYQVVSAGISADTRIVEIDPDDPMNPRTIIAGPGRPHGNVQILPDGKLYQTSYTSTTTYLAVIDPASSAPPTIVTVGAGQPNQNLYRASDGNFYMHTFTGTDSSNYAAQLVRIDLANPTNPTTFNAGPGRISDYSYVKAGADGKLYVTTTTAAQYWSTGALRVAQIDPNNPMQPTVYAAGTGSANGNVLIAPNGTMYQQIYAYNSGSGNYTYSVAMLNTQTPSSPTVVALTGSPQASGLAPNGTGYFSSYTSASGTGGTVYTHYVTIVAPQDPTHPRTVNLGQTNTDSYGSIEVGPDGTAFYFRQDYNPTTRRYENYRVTTISSAGNFSTFVLPQSASGYSSNSYYSTPVFGTDGTRYQMSRTYTGSSYVYHVTVIDPDNAANSTAISLPSAPVGNIVAGKNGTTYVALPRTGTSPANYETPIMVFTAADPYHPTTVKLAGSQVGSLGVLEIPNGAGYLGGSAFIVTDSGSGTLWLNALSWEDPTHPIRSGAAGAPVDSNLVKGPDGKYYLAFQKTVSGTLSTYVMAIDLAAPFSPVTINAGPGAAKSQVQVGPDGKLYQISETSVTGASTYVTIINPSTPSSPTIVAAGPGRAWSSTLAFDANGAAYLTTYTGGESITDTTRLVRINPSNPANPTVVVLGSGKPTSSPTFRPDGTIYQPFYSKSVVSGQTRYTNSVAVISPSDFTHPTIVTLPGQATTAGLTFGADGTGYGTSRSANGTAFTNYVTVIDPLDLAHPRNVTLPGQLAGATVTHGLNGIAYVMTQSSTGSTYTNYVTVVDRLDPAHSSDIALPGTASGVTQHQVGPDGDLYMLTRTPTATAGVSTYHLSTIDPQNPVLRTINLGDLKNASFSWNQAFASDGTTYLDVTPVNGQSGVMSVDRSYSVHSGVVTVPGTSPFTRVIGPDGTSYQISTTYVDGVGWTSSAVTVIDPDDPTHATSVSLPPGYPPGGTVEITDDGTAYLLVSQEYISGRGYVSRIMVFDPADPYHPTIFEVPGNISANDIIANADGSALVPYYASGTTKLFRIDTARSYQPPVQP
jgi:YVTN family beta-propeller protein/VCBS repeat-containing protein